MAILKLRSYGTYKEPIGIVAEQVTHFWQIDFNGNHGVEVALLSGKTVRIDGFMSDFEKQLNEALNGNV
jgi:hypothetical protein